MHDCKNALILGFGGGNIASEFQHMNMKVDAVDLDGRVLDVAKKYFYYSDPALTFIVDDARHFVRTVKKKYDLIVFDVLNNDAQPSYVFTTESLTELKNILADDGMAIIEFQELEKTKGIYVYQSICNTLLSLDYKTYFDDEEEGGDIFIVASLKDIDISKYYIENLNSCCREKSWAAGFIRQPYKKCEKPFARGVVLYDDKPMIDVLNAELVKHWRINANSMYGNEMLKSDQRLFY
jgi:spermidine synthase